MYHYRPSSFLTRDVQNITKTTSDPRQDTFQENICTHNRVPRHVGVHDRPPEGAEPPLTSARHEGAGRRAGSVVCGSAYKQAVIVETVKSGTRTGARTKIVKKKKKSQLITTVKAMVDFPGITAVEQSRVGVPPKYTNDLETLFAGKIRFAKNQKIAAKKTYSRAF